MRDRQFGLWDSTKLSSPQKMTIIDASTGILDIFFDNDSNMLFLGGKVVFKILFANY